MAAGRTERPVRHGGRAADELGVLVDDVERRGSGKEVEVEHAADDLVGEVGAAVLDVHAVAVEQEHAMRGAAAGGGVAHVEVERVGAVEVDVHGAGRDVGVPEREGVVALQPERALGVLAQPVQRRRPDVRRQRRGQLQVPVLEHQRRGGVEEDVAAGAPGHGEAERRGVQGEGQVGRRRGEDAAVRRGGARARLQGDLPRRLARDDALGDLPSWVVGVGDADVQPAVCLKTAAGAVGQ